MPRFNKFPQRIAASSGGGSSSSCASLGPAVLIPVRPFDQVGGISSSGIDAINYQTVTTSLESIVDITGSGVIDLALIELRNTTDGNFQTIITIDGVEAYNNSVNNASSAGVINIIGGFSVEGGYMEPIPFSKSLKIESVRVNGGSNSRFRYNYYLT